MRFGGGEIIHFNFPVFAIKLLKILLDTDFIKTTFHEADFWTLST